MIKRLDERVQFESLAALGIKVDWFVVIRALSENMIHGFSCQKCDFAVEFEKSKEQNSVFVCPQCKSAWCRNCENAWNDEHFGLKCSEYVEKLKQNQDHKYWAAV